MQTQNKFSVYPTIGQTVEVRHRAETDKRGDVRLKAASMEARTIARVYICEDGVPTVQDSAGDVWAVKPGRMNTWETFVPQL